MKRFLAILIVATMAFCAEGVISVAANVRTAPSSKAEIACDSLTVEIVGDYSDWFMVQFTDGTDHANDGIVYQVWTGALDGDKVGGKGVTLRDKDGKKTGKSAKPGATFKIVKKLITWYQVKMPDGTEGWIYKNSIKVID